MLMTKYSYLLLRYSFSASNPAVFTDGYCYLDWIAEQYNLKVKQHVNLMQKGRKVYTYKWKKRKGKNSI